MLHDVNPYDWLNKFCNAYEAAIISIVSRRGLRIEACRENPCCGNQPNKNKLSLYKMFLSLH